MRRFLLLSVVLLIAAVLAVSRVSVRPYLREHEIRQAVVAHGGWCVTKPGPAWLSLLYGDEVCATTFWVDLSLARRNKNDQTDPLPKELLVQLGELTELRALLLNGNPITDEMLDNWSNLTSLQWLDLGSTLVRDPGAWPEFPLQRLDVSSTTFGDKHAQQLARFPALRHLNLSHTYVSNDSAETLASLRHLQSLKLTGSGIDRRSSPLLSKLLELRNLDGALPLAEAKWEWYRSPAERRCILVLYLDSVEEPAGVEELDLSDTWFYDADVPRLGRFPNLKTLNLNSTFITDSGMAQLAAVCPQLIELDVGNTQISDAGLAPLAALSQLQTLRIGQTEITDVGLTALGQVSTLRTLALTVGTIRGDGVTWLEDLPLEYVQLVRPGRLNRRDLLERPLSVQEVQQVLDCLKTVDRRGAAQLGLAVDETLVQKRALRVVTTSLELTPETRQAIELISGEADAAGQ